MQKEENRAANQAGTGDAGFDETFYTLTEADRQFLFYEEEGERQKALELGEAMYEARSRLLGEEHELTLLAMSSLVRLYTKTGEYQKGMAVGEKLCAIRVRTLGEEAPETLKAWRKLATVYGDSGRFERAIELMEKVYQIQSRNGDREELHYPVSALFHYYQKTGDTMRGIAYGEKLCEIRKALFGEADERTQAAMKRLAALKRQAETPNA